MGPSGQWIQFQAWYRSLPATDRLNASVEPACQQTPGPVAAPAAAERLACGPASQLWESPPVIASGRIFDQAP